MSGCTPQRPQSNSEVPTGTGEPLRTIHTAMNIAPQGQGEGCQDTPAVECPQLPGSWHLSWATQPVSSTPGGRWLAGLLTCLAPPPWAKGSWEREGAERLAPRLGLWVLWHPQGGWQAGSLRGQASHGSGHAPVSRGRPRRIKGASCKSPGFRGNHVWVESLALCPISLSVLICIMGTMNTLLFYLHGKVSPEQWPVLTSVSYRKG